MPTSPLLSAQSKAKAVFVEKHGWRLPAVYSSTVEEYRAATQGSGLVDRSFVGRLEIRGADGLDLLDRLSTNRLEDLVVGRVMRTVLTSNKGRILDLLSVLRLEDHLLVLTGPENRARVAEHIDFYTFAEDVAVRDVTEESAMLGLMGPDATALLDELTGLDASSMEAEECAVASVGEIDVLLVKSDFAGLSGFDIIVPELEAVGLWDRLLAAGASPVGMDALEAIRVERGVPVHGSELTEEYNPLEANLLDSISFNKGCYVGQEVVARLDTYKKVKKRLVGLSWEGDGDAPTGGAVVLDGKQVGTITSTARSPRLMGWIGLAYVGKAQAETGTRLTISHADGELPALVEELPFKP